MTDKPPAASVVSGEMEAVAFRATGPAGQSLSGTLDAASVAKAQDSLLELGLRTSEIKAVHKPRVRWPQSGDDFLAFNQQVAQLTAAGMPVEFGLRLIARDMRKGRLSGALAEVAADLEAGKSLPQAIAAHRSHFPASYGPLVEAGINAGNLSAVLLNLGAHMAFVQRMRSAMWRALTYPLAVLTMLAGVSLFLCIVVIPPVETMTYGVHYRRFNWRLQQEMDYEVPFFSKMVFAAADIIRSPEFLIGAGILLASAIAVFLWMRMTGPGREMGERLVTPAPIVGRPLRMSLAARWCSAAALGIDAGLDISRAIDLAGVSAGSAAVAHDSQMMRQIVDSGGKLGGLYGLSVLPRTIPAAIDMASASGNLAEALRTLAQMYEHQANVTVDALRVFIGVVLMLVAGALVSLTVLAIVMPVFQLISFISSPF